MSVFEGADVLIRVNFSGAAQCRDQLCIGCQNPLPAKQPSATVAAGAVSLPFIACQGMPF